MKIGAQITSIFYFFDPMQDSSQNTELSYQYPCYVTRCISNILDIPQVIQTGYYHVA